MQESLLWQGRRISDSELEWLRDWIAAHPEWSRKRLARELCDQWQWHSTTGQRRDFTARTFLLKLEARGLITLPPLHAAKARPWGFAIARRSAGVPLTVAPVAAALSALVPLSFIVAPAASTELHRCWAYLAQYHYLGFSRPVGENLAYLVRDRYQRDLACVLFGAPAWKVAPRDAFIGWNDRVRQQRVSWLTNNARFLILPGVQVAHLASHVLGRITRRLRADWEAKYGHPVYLVETFVETERFRGTCYRAANWIEVGQTQGRGRYDRAHTRRAPVKSVWLYPLVPNFRDVLCRAVVDA
jgi:hypothetical protein